MMDWFKKSISSRPNNRNLGKAGPDGRESALSAARGATHIEDFQFYEKQSNERKCLYTGYNNGWML